MNSHARLLIPLLILLMAATAAVADNTMVRRLRPIPRTEAVSPSLPRTDTIPAPSADSVPLSGYDKPLRATRETLCATNLTALPIVGLLVEITYTDLSGRQLHSRRVPLDTDIPPGETRLLSFPSWDTNHTFFYRRGPQPRTSGVTPYDVTMRIIHIVTTH